MSTKSTIEIITEWDIEKNLELPVIGVIGLITPDKEMKSVGKSRRTQK